MIVAAKTVVSSAILQTPSLNIFSITSNGGFTIEDIIVSTDVTGLAAGTNFILTVDGNSTFFTTAVSGLGSYNSKDLAHASVAASKVVYGDGQHYVDLHCTAADCTGAGKVTIAIYVRGLNGNSSVQIQTL